MDLNYLNSQCLSWKRKAKDVQATYQVLKQESKEMAIDHSMCQHLIRKLQEQENINRGCHILKVQPPCLLRNGYKFDTESCEESTSESGSSLCGSRSSISDKPQKRGSLVTKTRELLASMAPVRTKHIEMSRGQAQVERTTVSINAEELCALIKQLGLLAKDSLVN